MDIVANPFDSHHYDLKVGRAVADPRDRALDLDAAIAAHASALDVVFVRVLQDSPLDRELRVRGERPADVLVTSTWTAAAAPVAAPRAGVSVETLDVVTDAADLTAIEAISADVLSRSHLHNDPRLPVERTRRIYAAWARNNATGRAQRTLVARAANGIIGYLSLLIRASEPVETEGAIRDAHTRVVIDLFAVGAQWQGQGVGAALLSQLDGFLRSQADVVASVGTQADNPALKLYRRFGYTPREFHATYHLWLEDEARILGQTRDGH